MPTLSVGGWRLELVCRPEALEAAAAARYRSFAVPDGTPPDFTASVSAEPPHAGDAAAGRLLDAKLHPRGADFGLDEETVCGTISMGLRQASLVLSSAAPLEDLEYLLRIVVAVVAYSDGGLLVHGSALIDDGRVRLFVGQSGSGKSTVVALSQSRVALGDDLILLRPAGSGWTAHGTPFWNPAAGKRRGETGSGPLAGVYKLIKDREVYLEPMSPASAAAELLANCPVVNGVHSLLPGVLARCKEVAAAVPVRALHFRKDDAFWSVVSAPGALPGGQN